MSKGVLCVTDKSPGAQKSGVSVADKYQGAKLILFDFTNP